MNEATTSNTARACVDCGEGVIEYGSKCQRCYDRANNSTATHELALTEDMVRRWDITDGERWARHAYAVQRRAEAELPITDGSDYRIAGLWTRIWDAFADDAERDGLWQLLVERIAGVPDFRTKRYSGTITLKFHFSDIEVEGDLSEWEAETAILEVLQGDLNHWEADETEVELDES